ncbi:MAG: glycosyltransferase family 9 protein [Rhodospirillales bacterium]|nr:glycosyltransferase family 9 protein [Rhodospirillales bacterium]
MSDQKKILVIKLGALGDFIQALGPMAAIRRHHPDAHITLLTTKPFVQFGEACGYFDDVWVDTRPRWNQPLDWVGLGKKLREGAFSRVYDLQNNDRTALYFRLFFKNEVEWVGAAKGASHRNDSPERTAGKSFAGHVQTLALAGIDTVTVDDLSWIKTDVSALGLQPPYVLLVPGCAPQHPYKRWPAKNYADLAKRLLSQGRQPVLIGTDSEADALSAIEKDAPGSLNLAGKTSLFDIAVLARGADAVVGNDTGPIHIAGPTGRPTLVLFSGASNPVRHAPQGAHVDVLQEENLENLPVETVEATLGKILA